MTREEAIAILDRRTTIPGDGLSFEDIEGAINMAIDALSGPELDQIEKTQAEWEWQGPCRDNNGRSWATCSACHTRQRIGDYVEFCPACGAPMTDEAVQMVMERLEALKDAES